MGGPTAISLWTDENAGRTGGSSGNDGDRKDRSGHAGSHPYVGTTMTNDRTPSPLRAHLQRARTAALACLVALAAVTPSAARAQGLTLPPPPSPGGIGYGRHALRPPRHDLRPPVLGADGSPIEVPDAALGEVPPDASLPSRSSSPLARHVNWCATRYRTYDRRTDSFVPRSGAARVRCDSPFR